MVDQLLLDLNDRMSKLEKDLVTLQGNITAIMDMVVKHQHVDGKVAIVEIHYLEGANNSG